MYKLDIVRSFVICQQLNITKINQIKWGYLFNLFSLIETLGSCPYWIPVSNLQTNFNFTVVLIKLFGN